LPKDLGDVLHFFLPDEEKEGTPRQERPATLPILALPIGERDVVRAAFAWNLNVEIARIGASATLIAPHDAQLEALWPEAGPGPLGCEVLMSEAGDLASLGRAALDVSVAKAADSADGGVVLVAVPPEWLSQPGEGLLRWMLLLSTSDSRDLANTYGLAKRLWAADSRIEIGVTVHGVRRVREARQAFERVARAAERHLLRQPRSYGLLVDDLHVYRAIVSRRPIGLEHPQSPAARALRDVAQLVLSDARNAAVA
jgi:hypothetical protein